MALMRRLLTNAQTKFRKMVDDNKQLGNRIEGDIQATTTTNCSVESELDVTNRPTETSVGAVGGTSAVDALSSVSSSSSSSASSASSREIVTTATTTHDRDTPPSSRPTATVLCERCSQNLEEEDVKVSEAPVADYEELCRLRDENERLSEQNGRLQQEINEMRSRKVIEETELEPKVKQLECELQRSLEVVGALKLDRKRLKAEKFDLLSQMKQLYGTLEDKEKELRDFIRNYEQRLKEGDHHHHHNQQQHHQQQQQQQQLQLAKTARSPSGVGGFGIREDSKRFIRILTVPTDDTEATAAAATTTTTTTRSSSFCVQRTETETEIVLVRQLQDEVTDQTYGQSSPAGCSDDGGSSSSGKVNGFHALSAPPINSPSDQQAVIRCVDVSKLSPSPPMPIDADVATNPIYVNTRECVSASPMGHGSTLTLDVCQTSSLSRSAEELTNMLGTLDLKRRSGTLQRRSNGHESGSKGGTWGSISKVFSRGRSRRSMDPSLVEFDKRTSWSPQNSLCASPLTEETYGEKLRQLDEARVLPMDAWRAPMVQAWLELSMGMYQYGPACAENIKSGKVLLELNDAELEVGLRMSNPMHRRKLRLAIEEFREPSSCKYPKASELSHVWVCNDWLPCLGLAQYVDAFALHLVDARVLDHITKKDMEKYLGVTRKFHQASISHAIQLLRMVGFDQQTLSERRSMCEQTDGDPLVWTNQRFIQWARSVDLAEYAENLRESGVHGAIVVLEPSFTSDTMATALGIPQSKNIIRRHLTTELESIIHPARVLLEQEYFHDRQLTKKDKYSIGSMGRNFSQSYAGGLPGSDGRRSSLRGSLTRALGLKVKQDLQHNRQHYSTSSHHLSGGANNAATSSTQHPQQQQQQQHHHHQGVSKTPQRSRTSQIPTRSRVPLPSPPPPQPSQRTTSRISSAPPSTGAASSISTLLAAPTYGSSRSTSNSGHRSTSSTSSSPSGATVSSSSVNVIDASTSHRRIKSSGDIETTTTAVTSV